MTVSAPGDPAGNITLGGSVRADPGQMGSYARVEMLTKINETEPFC